MFKLFLDGPIAKVLGDQITKVDKAIDQVPVSDLNNYETEKIAALLVPKYRLDALSVDIENVKKDPILKPLQGKHFPPGYDVDKNRYYERVSVNYTYDVSGLLQLLAVQPTTRTFQHHVDADVDNNKLVWTYNTLLGEMPLSDAQRADIRKCTRPIHDEIPLMVDAINKDVDGFNSQLHEYVVKAIDDRKKAIDDKRKHDEDL